MKTKEVKIVPPVGFEIDREHSTFECIKFKPIEKKRFIDDESIDIHGYYIKEDSTIHKTGYCSNTCFNYNIFFTEKQAKSALAMACISQIMANDERFGGIISYEEWDDDDTSKFYIGKFRNKISAEHCYGEYYFLTFHTKEQRDLFLEENEQLVKDYLMID